MKVKIVHLLIIPFVIVISACATMNTVATAPVDTGVSRSFKADNELVKAAVLASMQNMNINIKQSQQISDGFSILFTKSVSPFSWGEVGRVLITKEDNIYTYVYVYTEKRSKYQITGTDTYEFSNSIFNGVDEILRKRNK